MANPPLFLTADEKKLFAKTPAALVEGWEVKDEKLKFKDSPEKYAIRLRNLHIENEVLQQAMVTANSMQKTVDILSLSQTIKAENVSQSDLLEVYYVMGPRAFTDLLALMLKHGLKTGEDVKIFVANALIRHELLVSMNLPPRY
jgi:hypothetical protein